PDNPPCPDLVLHANATRAFNPPAFTHRTLKLWAKPGESRTDRESLRQSAHGNRRISFRLCRLNPKQAMKEPLESGRIHLRASERMEDRVVAGIDANNSKKCADASNDERTRSCSKCARP